MTVPNRIWAEEPEVFDGMGFWQDHRHNDLVEYIRRDPAVLVSLPEVHALIQRMRDEALEEAAGVADAMFYPDETKISARIRTKISARIRDAIRALKDEVAP